MRTSGAIVLGMSGESAVKGRNGYFHLRDVQLTHNPLSDTLRVEFYSRLRGDVPPAVMELTPDDARRLAGAILDWVDISE